ncbi:hypothetical protein [Paenibacillus abyssi]|uniref:hypothetical protein n=1 Tax=Paenibacillus abyssi TaxID=1340531 RepID=UPI001664B3E7|nr:hypothetical protein [Paenibacillus abyssi]
MILIVYLLLVNLIAFATMACDKSHARNRATDPRETAFLHLPRWVVRSARGSV